MFFVLSFFLNCLYSRNKNFLNLDLISQTFNIKKENLTESIGDTYTAPHTGKYTFDNCIMYLYKGNVYEKSELCNASTLTTIECHGSGDECE